MGTKAKSSLTPMRRGRRLDKSYAKVVAWLENAEPDGSTYTWATFGDEEEARKGLRRLAASLRPQVKLAPGLRHCIRRTEVDSSGKIAVFVFVEHEPRARMPQGQRS